MNLRMTLQSDGDEPKQESVEITIPDDEWKHLLLFHNEVERLRATKFVQHKSGGEIKFIYQESHGLKSNAQQYDQDEVGAMLLKLRPFILQKKEPFQFGKIKNILKQRLDHFAFQNHLDVLHSFFSLQQIQKKMQISGPGRPPLSFDVVKDWLNAYEYHRDINAQRKVENDLGILGLDQSGLPFILVPITEMIKAILSLGDLVETLMEVEAGKNDIIKCPKEWLLEN